MKIIEVAREQKDLLNEGIAYIAVWKQMQRNGKASWFTEDVFPDGGVDHDEPIFSDEQKSRLAEIAALDENAVLLNGYIHSWIGSADEPLNAASIAVGIEKHYTMHNALICDYLAGEEDEAELAAEIDLEAADTEGEAAEETIAEIIAKPEFKEAVRALMSNEADYPEPADDQQERDLIREQRLGNGENGMSPNDVPDTITIELPALNVKPEILTALLNSKNSLIDAALGEDAAWEHEYGTDGLPLGDLPIEFADGKVRFEWLRFGADSDAVAAWSAFLATACKFSKTAKRVTAKDGLVENQKFAFRTFMVKLGMNDADNKWVRRYLLRNLEGDTAFATPESKAKWQAKHLKNHGTEVADNEISE
jgi:hypothetical protein